MSSRPDSAIVAYVPALHAGYLGFFAKHPHAPVYVLGPRFINAYPRLNRDLRALKPQEIVAALCALGVNAEVLTPAGLKKVRAHTHLYLPDEDVSRDFAEKHLRGRKPRLESIFLRWDGVFSNQKKLVAPDVRISRSTLHRSLMKRALRESEKSADWWRQIGGLLVKGGKVVALSHVRYFPSDLALDVFGTPRITVDAGERPDLYISMHAEADLIALAARDGVSLKGASLYTTTFPCINCAFLIARAGIRTLYYAEGYSNLDSERVLRSAGVKIVLVEGA